MTRTISGGAGTDMAIFGATDDTITSATSVSVEIVSMGAGNDLFDVLLSSPLNASFDLGTIDGAKGFQLFGATPTDEAGAALSGVGDVNGDGFADFVIGAPGTNSHDGEAYLVFGRGDGFLPSIDLGVASPHYARLEGLGQAGFSVSGGDINGDGLNDVVVGANTAGGAGRAHVVFGKATGWADVSGTMHAIDLTTLNGTNGFTLCNGSAATTQFGFDATFAGDVNGDGNGDLLVTAPDDGSTGKAYVVYGKASGWAASNQVEGPGSVAHTTLTGANIASLSLAGDVNGDGFGDFIVGAPVNDGGRAYLVFGGANLAGTIDVTRLADRHTGVEILSGGNSDAAGYSVAGGGDVNGDGRADLIVGARGTSTAYVVFGRATADWSDGNGNGNGDYVVDPTAVDGTNGFVIGGVGADDKLGWSVAFGGDVNGDGLSDIIVGAPESSTSGFTDNGAAYIVYGRAAGWQSSFDVTSLTASQGVRLEGAGHDDRAGFAVSGLGDINGDGLDDVATSGTGGGIDIGRTYVLFGDTRLGSGAETAARTLLGGAGDDILRGDDTDELGNANIIFGEAGDDVLSSAAAMAGHHHLLFGGEGTDTASFARETGSVYADLNTGGGHVDGVLANLMIGVENATGGWGADALVGNGLANRLDGGEGASDDLLFGGGGDDVLVGGNRAAGGHNQLFGGDGSDTVDYSGETLPLTASLTGLYGYVGGVAGADLCDTYNSIENLTGGSASDVLVGDAGANVIEGGAVADQLYGRGGADTFVYDAWGDSNVVTGYDTIVDFVTGLDRIDLRAFHTDVSHVSIVSGPAATKLLIEATPGTFVGATDLAISLIGVNAISAADILF